MKQDGRDLVAQFRALAPERRPISLQRWGPRRILLALACSLGVLLFAQSVYALFTPAELHDRPTSRRVRHQRRDGPDGPGGADGHRRAVHRLAPCRLGGRRAWSSSAATAGSLLQAADHRVEVTLRPPEACAIGRRREVPSDELGMRRFERADAVAAGRAGHEDVPVRRRRASPYDFDLDDAADASLLVELDGALAFQPRSELVDRGRASHRAQSVRHRRSTVRGEA